MPTTNPEPNLDTRMRLKNRGPDGLSTPELLAVVLAFGRPGGEQEYLKTAASVLAQPGGLRELRNSTVDELAALRGIGEAKACAIAAAIELGARIATDGFPDRPVISSPHDVDALLRGRLAHLDREVFVVVLLDTKNHVIAAPTIAIGSLGAATVHPREVFKPAVKASAASVILAHNHPSGVTAPSAHDIACTERLCRCGDELGIEVLDHVIIGRGFTSLKETGRLRGGDSGRPCP